MRMSALGLTWTPYILDYPRPFRLVHETNKYILHKIYLPDGKNKDGRLITTKTALREIYLVDKLAASILLGNDILVPEEIDLLFSKGIAYIDSCDIDIPIEVHLKESLIRRVINSKEASIIPPHSNATMVIHYLILDLCQAWWGTMGDRGYA